MTSKLESAVNQLVEAWGQLPGWEDLNAYRVDIHPDKLIVTTNANPEQMREAMEAWDPDIEAVNIETVLHRMGYFAVTAYDSTDVDVWKQPEDIDALVKAINLAKAEISRGNMDIAMVHANTAKRIFNLLIGAGES